MIFFVLLFGFILRIIGINQSLWLDEAITINVVKLPLARIISDFSINDFHPPLHYLFLHFWQNVFGNGVVAMRLSSVLFSIITIYLVYLIGKEIKNKNFGLWAAVFTGINPLLIYYSQELRMYSMVVMSLTGALYFFIKKKYIWFNIFIFLSFLIFYGSVFFIVTILLYFLINKKYKLFFGNLLGIILAIIVISPLLLVQLKNSTLMLSQVTNWSLVLGKVNLKNLFLIPFKFSVGRISWYPKILYYLIGGGWTIIVFGLASKQIIKIKILGFLLIIPIFLGILFSIKSPLLQYFRFLYLVPILALILAEIKSIQIKKFLVGGFLVFSLMYLLNPKMYREDWKSLVKNLENNQKVYMIESFSDPVKFYNSTIKIEDIKIKNPNEVKVMIIPYGEIIHGVDTKKKMTNLGYKLIKTNLYREITLETWEK